MASRICILDDDAAFMQALVPELQPAYELIAVESVGRFREVFAPRAFELIVLDMRLEEAKEGLGVLREILRIDPFQPVVVATAYADTETYLEALQAGALLYLDKTRHSPTALALLFDAVIQQGRLKRDQAAVVRALERSDPLDLIGVSEEAQRIRREIERIAPRAGLPVVVTGESGSGRELVARNLHARRQGGSARPLCVLPPTALPTAEILRLLFGSGVVNRRRGLLEDAHGSGLVVRAADRLPAEVIRLILKAWSELQFLPADSLIPQPFEAALFFLCEDAGPMNSVLQTDTRELIELSPLRDRKEDIPLLASYFLDGMRRRGRDGATALDAEAGQALLAHDWPGNVAELRAALEYASLRAAAVGDSAIGTRHLPIAVAASADREIGRSNRDWDLDYQEAQTQLALVERAIGELATSNKTKLAGFLHVPTPTTLSRRVERSLERYPGLADSFPRTAEAFGKRIAISET